MKKKVFVMAGYYTPSIKGGGPVRSIKSLVDNLTNDLEFYILAHDRDLGDAEPFENITLNEWVTVGNANVYYSNISNLKFREFVDIVNSVECDTLYLNSFFNFKLSIVPLILRKLGKIKSKKVVVAPRGEFSSGALGLKANKKKIYISIVKKIGLYTGVTWHPTAEIEKNDVIKIFGNNIEYVLANNLTEDYRNLKYDKEIYKTEGSLKVIFISRIHPKKNLMKAIEFLESVKGRVEFSIYGPLEDSIYWSECKLRIDNLPSNIKVSYQGIIGHEDIMSVFKKHHVFLFPTLGENFGHVISEALVGGCPVIISDQTPWNNLKDINVGWDINLNDEQQFIASIQKYVDMNYEDYRKTSESSFNYGKSMSNNEKDFQQYLRLFE